MPPQSTPRSLLTEARRSAQLSQRELARRADTVQSVVARIEGGATSPTWDTLARLLEAAGFELRVTLQAVSAEHSHMMADVGRILRLSPEARLIELAKAASFLAAARRRV